MHKSKILFIMTLKSHLICNFRTETSEFHRYTNEFYFVDFIDV